MGSTDKHDQSGSRWVSLAVMALGGTLIFSGLVLTYVVWAGAALVIAGVFGFAALHYLVWGWWLSKVIHEEEESAALERHDRP